MQYEVVVPGSADVDDLRRRKVLQPFDEQTLDFVSAVSGRILKDAGFKPFPELMALAFWMRKANILKLKTAFEERRGGRLWVGRGLVFHIAPANVDTLFVYSWYLSMLVGNCNIVRLSSTSNPQIEALLRVVNEIVDREQFSEIRKRVMIVRYGHSDETTAYFSSRCNMRVIWGGDETIRRIRAIPIPAKAVELTFADRFSFSLIGAEAFLTCDKKEALIVSFYNDAYWFGQNACSSPRLVVWLGDGAAVEQARSLFWALLEKLFARKGVVCTPAVAVDKLVAECAFAIGGRGQPVIEKTGTTLLNRVFLDRALDIDRDAHPGGGLFYEFSIRKLDELADLITSKDQTMSVFGVDGEALKELLVNNSRGGVDRAVPIGQALDFSVVWDGHDLLREFCREIEVTV